LSLRGGGALALSLATHLFSPHELRADFAWIGSDDADGWLSG
jgi:hypothetical protein